MESAAATNSAGTRTSRQKKLDDRKKRNCADGKRNNAIEKQKNGDNRG